MQIGNETYTLLVMATGSKQVLAQIYNYHKRGKIEKIEPVRPLLLNPRIVLNVYLLQSMYMSIDASIFFTLVGSDL